MNQSLRTLLGLALLAAPLATGCASRTAPFDDMDKAQVTILRLTAPAPPPQAVLPTAGALPGIPGLPGLPPEMAAAGQQLLQGVNSAVPGLIPPGLLPGQAATQPAPVQQQVLWNGLAVVASMPVPTDDIKNDLLDLFGDEDSFQAGGTNCTTAPGMGLSMVRQGQPNVDLLVSFTCNKAMGVGFQWPYKKDALTGESNQKLGQIYQVIFGMAVPPGS